ncbi:hypothetical protein HYALB_00013210 [Hymenoscyphus albidus]|uniref:Uncharacterized protein n=1 Tax=Hymenoscyphus albidus TaxID=595503 RepID=A0A9N9LUX3_9HELO|nr:hypothetical protein HYALB_00013210 [Hymenoscyphus albidus]
MTGIPTLANPSHPPFTPSPNAVQVLPLVSAMAKTPCLPSAQAVEDPFMCSAVVFQCLSTSRQRQPYACTLARGNQVLANAAPRRSLGENDAWHRDVHAIVAERDNLKSTVRQHAHDPNLTEAITKRRESW